MIKLWYWFDSGCWSNITFPVFLILQDRASYDNLKHFSYSDWLVFFYKTWWEFTPSRGHIRYIILALSGILVSPDIWVHFRIRIEIPDHFDSVLRIDVGIDDGAQVCVPHGHSSVDEMKPHIIKYPSNKRSEATCLSGQAPIGRVGLETAQKTQLCEQYDGRRSTIHRLWYYKSPQKLISRLSFQNPRPTLPNRPTSSARWNRGKVGLIVNNSASWLTWRGSKRLVQHWTSGGFARNKRCWKWTG